MGPTAWVSAAASQQIEKTIELMSAFKIASISLDVERC
jgi:hypothetical protein